MQGAIIRILVIVILFAACRKEKKHDLWAPSEPAIVSIQPDRGGAETVVTISGRRFSGSVTENLVTINGVQATVVEASDHLLKVIVPDQAGTGPVAVTVNGHTGSGPVFNYVETPKQYVVSTFAGSTSGFADGSALSAKFTNPDGVVVDGLGNVVVCDRTNHSIRLISPGGTVSTIAGNGTAGFADGIPGMFKFPWQATVDNEGNIIVADKDNDRIRKVAPNGQLSTIAGTGTRGFQDGSAAQFNNPLDVAVDADGNIFVADRSNHRIRKIDAGGTVTTFVGDGSTAILNLPVSITFDKEGNLIIADLQNYQIKMVDKLGNLSVIAGTGVKGFSDGTPGDPLTAQLGDVYGLAVDSKGNIIFADASNARIRMISPGSDGKYQSGTVSTIAGTGQKGKNNGSGMEATFNNPYDVAVDAGDNIYVADNSNHLIRKIAFQ